MSVRQAAHHPVELRRMIHSRASRCARMWLCGLLHTQPVPFPSLSPALVLARLFFVATFGPRMACTRGASSAPTLGRIGRNGRSGRPSWVRNGDEVQKRKPSLCKSRYVPGRRQMRMANALRGSRTWGGALWHQGRREIDLDQFRP
jgi:hypothetical protein